MMCAYQSSDGGTELRASCVVPGVHAATVSPAEQTHWQSASLPHKMRESPEHCPVDSMHVPESPHANAPSSGHTPHEAASGSMKHASQSLTSVPPRTSHELNDSRGVH